LRKKLKGMFVWGTKLGRRNDLEKKGLVFEEKKNRGVLYICIIHVRYLCTGGEQN